MGLSITENVFNEGLGELVLLIHEQKIGFSKMSAEQFSPDGGCLIDISALKPKLRRPGLSTLAVGTWSGAKIGLVEAGDLIEIPSDFTWYSLRELLPVLDTAQFALVSRAMQLLNWREEHRFCGRCGSTMSIALQDRAMVCDSCEQRYYPKISPCVIGVIVKGKQMLLANGIKHAKGMFSAIAGFVEPGETAEQAFHREVAEELDIKIENLRYVCSQNWPFPGQLMLGFVADYAGGSIRVDTRELLEANWFDIDNLPLVPPEYTISGRLVRMVARDLGGEKLCI